MTEFYDCMVDLETTGLPPNGALLSIGGVFFDTHTGTLGPTFSQVVHLGSAVAAEAIQQAKKGTV